MLVLRFKHGEGGYIICGEVVARFAVIEMGRSSMKLGIDAPASLAVFRDAALSPEDRNWCESQISRQQRVARIAQSQIDANPQQG